MSQHDDTVSLRQMLDFSRDAVSLSVGRNREDLDSDRMFNLAMARAVEVIGEASNRLSKETRDKYPEIPWSQIISTRNRLIHAYDKVDFDILWDILHLDLPPLIQQLEAILGDANSNQDV